MTNVQLRIYEFQLFDTLREFHAEIVAFNKSFSYSDEGLEKSVVLNKDGLEGYTLIATYELGYADIYEYEFDEFYVPDIIQEFTAEEYHLFENNCRHYALHLINILKPAKSDIRIKVLQDLNNMSELLGNVMNTLINIMTTINTFTTQLVIGLCLIVSFIISCRYLLSERKRDYILISIMFILMLVFINRNRL